MKTRQEVIEEYQESIRIETNLEKNSASANDNILEAYHRGRKEIYLKIANYLSRWEIKDAAET